MNNADREGRLCYARNYMNHLDEMKNPKALVHTVVHFIGVVMLYVVVTFFPFWALVLTIVVHQIHMKLLGNCFLTRWAHRDGIMIGMSYWEYVPYLFGAKDWKKTGKQIDIFIKVTLLLIFLTRVVLAVVEKR